MCKGNCSGFASARDRFLQGNFFNHLIKNCNDIYIQCIYRTIFCVCVHVLFLFSVRLQGVHVNINIGLIQFIYPICPI